MVQKLTFLVLSAALSFCVLGTTATISALSSADWKAGRIIDDGRYTDKNSMSVAQIQNFLNSKVGTGGNGRIAGQCDTNGVATSEFGGGTRAQYGASKGNPAPFTCLKDFYEVPKTSPSPGIPANNYGGAPIPAGAKSAAQLIWDAAQTHSISPKVLLVTIQKESAGPLTTDDWPLKSQYTYAMGAHCPDSGPGGSANCDSNYAGFSIQIAESARLMRYYLDNMSQPWWPYKKPGNNAIRYHPNQACGSSNVGIETKATAALYTYTPYQPNAIALSNLYGGQSDGCSSYGNRNFWRIYNDWFGSTIASAASQSPYAKGPCPVPDFNSQNVGRLYQSETNDYLYTTSRAEACVAVSYGYIWDGIVMRNAPGSNTIPIYRLANQTRHLYTSDPSVKADYLQTKGYHDEGIAFYAYATQLPGTIPVYCLIRDLTVAYTSAGGEKTYLEQFYGFNTAGTAFFTEQMAGEKTRLFRLNRWNYDRLYTVSQTEASNAIFTAQYGEEVSGMLEDSAPSPASTPVYRLVSPDGRHFYTRDRHERDLAVIFYKYFGEGIGFYAPISTTPGVSPVYRLSNYQSGGRLFTPNAVERNSAITSYRFTDEGVGWYSY